MYAETAFEQKGCENYAQTTIAMPENVSTSITATFH